ncbi:hypothetical protein SASPL_149506 [Salvia splendens]|uniref:non-specific serine/threonine protein kinase n=1 Tax=Salvia splendens TaxID=180675 RepID=A0A8X8WB91_SALSN|nr:hypothetical protein SASPL_149506 [Salvia splendens]
MCHQRSMFLIYDYMERGSLFSVLKDEDESMELNWKKRLNVVKGIAKLLDKRLPSPDEDVRVSREVAGVVKTALKCISSDPKSRPSMKEVAQELAKHPPRLPIDVVAANVSNTSGEFEALMAFEWPHINSNSTVCEWIGITCDDGGCVTEISLQTHLDLSYNSLKSELPLSLSNLTNLEVLNISYNRIFGAIPSGIGYLLHLIALDLSFNHPGDFVSSMTRMKRSTQFAQNMMVQRLLDKRLASPEEDVRLSREVARVVKTALKCISSDPKLRPCMKEVSQELAKHPPRLTMPFRSISMLHLMHSD